MRLFMPRSLLIVILFCTLVAGPSLLTASASSETDTKTPIIIVLDDVIPDQALEQLTAVMGSFPVKYKFRSLPGIAASLTEKQIAVLERMPFVKTIEQDSKVAHITLDTATLWFGTDAASTDFGVDGNTDGSSTLYSKGDVVIAVIDTGIDALHVDLDGKVIGWTDFVNGRGEPYDDHGHGTHVSSIAAGTGEGNAVYKGVAPGAALVAVKVLDSAGSGYVSDVDAGIQWVIDNRATYGIEVMSMSLGIAGNSDGTDSTSTLVNRAVDAGIVAVVAAGNSGPKKYTIGSPAAAEKAVTVGAMADVGEKGFYLASFCSRGPTKDGRIKPDICAPGVSIAAAKAGSESGYTMMSGTSMATPFVSGTVALILAADPSLNPSEVKNLLMNKAVDWGPSGKDVDYGSGRLDAYEAVEAAKGTTGLGLMGLPSHEYRQDSLPGTGNNDYWMYDVTTTAFPIAVTLVMPDWTSGFFSATPDFDLYLYNPSGAQVASSTGVTRQETISVTISTTGTYKVRVYSYSGSGNYFFDISAGLGPVDSPPTVRVDSPQTGSTVSGSIIIQASASDDFGLSQVDYSVDQGDRVPMSFDGVYWTATWKSTSVLDGSHSIAVRATDTKGQTSTDSVTVTVDNVDDPPSVSILDPKQGNTISGTYKVKVSASDDREITKVELRIDGGGYIDITSKYDSTNGYYHYDWDTRTVTDGTHSLEASAADSNSQSTRSSLVTVTVSNAQPTMHVESITMSLERRSGSTRAVAVVTILDANGKPVSGVAVSGVWSGLTSAPTVGVTNSKGQVTFKSSYVRNAHGTFKFTVTAVVKAGWTYNQPTPLPSNSITVP